MLAFARRGCGGPAAPQVAHDVFVGARRVEAHVFNAGDLALGVVAPLAVDKSAHADVAHVAQWQQAVLLVVEHGAALAVNQTKSLQ